MTTFSTAPSERYTPLPTNPYRDPYSRGILRAVRIATDDANEEVAAGLKAVAAGDFMVAMYRGTGPRKAHELALYIGWTCSNKATHAACKALTDPTTQGIKRLEQLDYDGAEACGNSAPRMSLMWRIKRALIMRSALRYERDCVKLSETTSAPPASAARVPPVQENAAPAAEHTTAPPTA